MNEFINMQLRMIHDISNTSSSPSAIHPSEIDTNTQYHHHKTTQQHERSVVVQNIAVSSFQLLGSMPVELTAHTITFLPLPDVGHIFEIGSLYAQYRLHYLYRNNHAVNKILNIYKDKFDSIPSSLYNDLREIGCSITSLELSGISCNVFEKISELFPNLRELRLHNVSEYALLSHLSKFTKLEHIDLSKNWLITDAIGPHLATLTHLQYVDLSECTRITNDMGVYLRRLTQLTYLNLSHCNNITDLIGKHITTLHKLEKLVLRHCREITGAIGTSFTALEQLQYLDLEHCYGITDEISTCFIHLKHLKQLNLGSCYNVTGKIGPHLLHCKELHSLHLRSCQTTDLLGPFLAELKKLQYLDLSHCYGVTDKIGPDLANLSQLRTLLLQQCRAITDTIGRHLIQLKELQRIDVSLCYNLTNDIVISCFVHLPKLHHINLSVCNVTNEIGPYIAKITQLTHLILQNCSKLTPGILPFFRQLRHLRVLEIQGCNMAGRAFHNLQDLSQLSCIRM